MKALFLAVFCSCLSLNSWAASEVLIVADEFPAMRILADQLKAEEHIPSTVAAQTNMPGDLAAFSTVVVYIHGKLNETAEKAFIDYTQKGGKLLVLHHSISSGKRINKFWFPFLGVTLPEGDFAQGGYKWIDPATLELANIAPDHFITTNKVLYPAKINYTRSDGDHSKADRPGFSLKNSEVYLNHQFTAPPTLLFGLKYTDPKSGAVTMQDRAGWVRPVGKGMVIYLMPGHSRMEFADPTYSRIVLNAVIYKP